MFQRILVPLDGSERAEQAIPLAARLARASGGLLFFVRVVDVVYEARMYSPLSATYLQEIEEKERTDAVDYLAKKTAASEFAGIQIRHLVVSGSAPSSLLQIAQQEHIDLIVLCSHGYTGLKRWALGSVAQKVVRLSPVSVLLVREQNLKLQEKVVQPVRAVVALDGSSFSEAALLPAAHLVAALSAPAEGELLLLQVVHMPTAHEKREYRRHGLDVDPRQKILQAANDSLQAARANLLRELPGKSVAHIAWSVIENGDTAEALIRAAEAGTGISIQQASDLLALTTHGRSGLQRWMMGSVAERVLQGSTLPLLIVHPQTHTSSSPTE